MSVVYQIRNLANDRCYIGSTLAALKRWRDHRSQLRGNRHHSIILQRAWCKYGEDAFVFEILEECQPERCLEREQHYLDVLNPAYNICRIAGNRLGVSHSEESKIKMSINRIGKHTGKDHHYYGKKLSKTTRQKMSQNHADVRGSNHPNAKLTEDDVMMIKQRLQQGDRGIVIARDFAVSRKLITEIKSGRAWRHV